MATEKQIKYATDLMKNRGIDPSDYDLENMPVPKMSDFIANLLKGVNPMEGIRIEDRSKFENVFDVELSFIKDPIKRDITVKIGNMIPSYFYEVPASSSGKYHPRFANAPDGLIKHTKFAVQMAKALIDHPMQKDEIKDNSDLIISALILHDAVKYGPDGGKWTTFEHPIQVNLLLKDFHSQDQELYSTNSEFMLMLSSAISSHMGPWRTNNRSKTVLPLPSTETEIFVHYMDYISSQRWIDDFYPVG